MTEICVHIVARNEAENLPRTLDALLQQTISFKRILLIDDGSTDNTGKIGKDYGIVVIGLPYHRENYQTDPASGWKMARVLNHAHPVPPCDFFMELGADTVLPREYVEIVVDRMEEDRRTVIAGGVLQDLPQVEWSVIGSGRIYRTSFWNTHIKHYPEAEGYETYPLFKALSLGYHITTYFDVIMKGQRRTKLFKSKYGVAMRTLDYFPPYALTKCFASILAGRKPGIQMTLSYLKRPSKASPNWALDQQTKNWIRLQQCKTLLSPKHTMKTWTERLRA